MPISINKELDSEKISLKNTTQRVEALADGIFSIILTLLVFDLKVPQLANVDTNNWQALWKELYLLWPQMLTFVFSFIILGIFWMGNRSHLSKIERTNRPYEFLTILFFFSVTLIPFGTKILGKYYFNQTAIIFFSSIVFLAGALFVLKWRYAVHHELIYSSLSEERISGVYKRSLVNPICALLAIAATFIDYTLAYTFFALPVLYYVFPEQIETHLQKMKPSNHKNT